MLIIEHAKSEQKLGLRKKNNDYYYEAHHILPKSLFPLWAKRKSNIVLLTAREHFFCHQLLYKIYNTKEMTYALFCMVNCKKEDMKLSSKQYAHLKKKYANFKSEDSRAENNSFYGKHHTDEQKAHWSEIRKNKGCGKNNPMFGKTHTDKTKQKLKEMNLGSNNPFFFGKHHTEESKRKISEKNKGRKPVLGRKWFTDGVECVLAETCPKGFRPGRIILKRRPKC